MSNNFDQAGHPAKAKAQWITPAVRQLKAGAAEANVSTIRDDGDTDRNTDNS